MRRVLHDVRFIITYALVSCKDHLFSLLKANLYTAAKTNIGTTNEYRKKYMAKFFTIGFLSSAIERDTMRTKASMVSVNIAKNKNTSVLI
jgi:hypothetical protein